MAPEVKHRQNMQVAWASLCTLGAFLYLFSSLWAALFGTILTVGYLLSLFGTRWFSRTAFAISVLAIAVWFGFPPPDQWKDILATAPTLVSDTSSAMFQ